jgi:hypothetical protein
VANYRWHVFTREYSWPIATELIRSMEKKGQAENDLAFWAK